VSGDAQDFGRCCCAIARDYGAKQQRRNPVPPSGIKQNVIVISWRALKFSISIKKRCIVRGSELEVGEVSIELPFGDVDYAGFSNLVHLIIVMCQCRTDYETSYLLSVLAGKNEVFFTTTHLYHRDLVSANQYESDHFSMIPIISQNPSTVKLFLFPNGIVWWYILRHQPYESPSKLRHPIGRISAG
jgi:hypothetical protein